MKHIFYGVYVWTPCWYTECFDLHFVHGIICFSDIFVMTTILKKEFVLWIVTFLKSIFKMFILANISPLIFTKYYSTKITPLLEHIAKMQDAILVPLPV